MKSEDIIVDLLKEVRTDQKSQSEVLTVHSVLLTEMKKDIAQNVEDLQAHMSQTKAIKELVLVQKEEIDLRLDSLEEPRKAFSFLKKLIIGAAAISGAILGIMKLLGKL